MLTKVKYVTSARCLLSTQWHTLKFIIIMKNGPVLDGHESAANIRNIMVDGSRSRV